MRREAVGPAPSRGVSPRPALYDGRMSKESDGPRPAFWSRKRWMFWGFALIIFGLVVAGMRVRRDVSGFVDVIGWCVVMAGFLIAMLAAPLKRQK